MTQLRFQFMTRTPQVRACFTLPGELVVDCFAGGGGASTGIEHAIGRPIDIAINHSPEAIAMHRANHPETKHYLANIYEVDPRAACAGRPVGLAWFSPECTNHSRAKGGKPRDEQSRTTGDVVIWWAQTVRPRIILVENVQEWQQWGPLDECGKPDKTQLGSTFRAWCAKLVDLGYDLQFRVLVAADYGTPTTRKRLFLVARRDRAPIVWPNPTHGKGRPESWRPASEIIDWTLPCPSIFDRKRPLAEATLRRIATGIRRYVVQAANPFLVKFHGGERGYQRGQTLHEPLRTLDTSNRFGLVSPFVAPLTHQGGARGRSLRAPLSTVCATNDKHIVVPFVAKTFGGPAALHKQSPGIDVRSPLGTVTATDHHALTAAFLTKFYGTSTGSEMSTPVPTVTGGGSHIAEVRAFLLKYYGADGHAQIQDIDDPLHTVTTKARFGLVTVHGVQYQIVDVGMRMFDPKELFAAMGFPEDYDITPEHNGKPLTKTAQTSLAGNSVCPQVARALVASNVRMAA